MKATLKSLLYDSKFKITIPQIQRDYAQGNEQHREIGKQFLGVLLETLRKPHAELKLDFIYGYTSPTGNEQHLYSPLDGQQRLTTLWLLYWYLYPNNPDWLANFSYDTRSSSRRFCEKLVANRQALRKELAKPEANRQEMLQNQPWFRQYWQHDPTVSAMLNMLSWIHDGVKTEEIDTLGEALAQEPIAFVSIDIKSEEFRLTDELYIKMNARGKRLTPFECDKAELQKVFNGVDPQLAEEFALNIDTKWLDLFWDKQGMAEAVSEARREKKDFDPAADLDRRMQKFFTSYAELQYYLREGKVDTNTFEGNRYSLYGQKE